MAPRALPFLLVVAALGASGAARADGPPSPPPTPTAPAAPARLTSGLEREPIEPGDPARSAASVALYVPRRVVELMWVATGTAAGLVRDEQFVPRVEEILSPKPGEISVFPFVFFESGQVPSLGAKMIAVGQNAAASFAAGYGPPQDGLAEGRIRLAAPRPLPAVGSLEALFDRRTLLTYRGLGQNPATDPRNQFVPLLQGAGARYLEQRVRVIASLGLRVADDVSIFLSSSYTRSRVDESPYSDVASLKDVFVAGSVPGVDTTNLVYSELATRLDTRATTGRPSPGVLVEGYAGLGKAPDTRAAYFRAGTVLGVYAPIVRRSNILGLRLVFDGLTSLSSEPLPFTWLLRQPEFRGIDDRRDHASAVASLDYRWAFAPHVGARLFADAATVGASPVELFQVAPRPAVGFGIDLFSRSTEIGQAAFSWSPDGVRLLLSFGVSTATHDRQHSY
jgi:hypothetical protein